ncbi:MAG: hypothetical protein IT336_15105 [Thermomicrobiales bacterium]|nr:hypothetical protein [Thermomicrobiales bacterium]
MDPLLAAALAGPAVVLVVKAIDVAIGRAATARSERDELREDLKLAREDADHERTIRRQTETDLAAEQSRSRELRRQLDDAEDRLREARGLRAKIDGMKSEHELLKTRHRQDIKVLQDRVAELRAEVRRRGGNTGPLPGTRGRS